jgi:hypothetical protein
VEHSVALGTICYYNLLWLVPPAADIAMPMFCCSVCLTTFPRTVYHTCRHAAQRAQQLKSAVNDLRKAVTSPLVPAPQPQQQPAVKAEEEGAAATEAVLDQQSGRLHALAGLTSALHALGKLVLVVAQSSKVRGHGYTTVICRFTTVTCAS